VSNIGTQLGSVGFLLLGVLLLIRLSRQGSPRLIYATNLSKLEGWILLLAILMIAASLYVNGEFPQ